MSSIISDLFYGSKQNILDQYLLQKEGSREIQRSKKGEESQKVFKDQTKLKKQQSFKNNQYREKSDKQWLNSSINTFNIFLQIHIPLQHTRITYIAEMGDKWAKTIVQSAQLSANLYLADCSSQEINMHSFIRILSKTSTQEYIGYIPIEIIVQSISRPTDPKHIQIPMKELKRQNTKKGTVNKPIMIKCVISILGLMDNHSRILDSEINSISQGILSSSIGKLGSSIGHHQYKNLKIDYVVQDKSRNDYSEIQLERTPKEMTLQQVNTMICNAHFQISNCQMKEQTLRKEMMIVKINQKQYHVGETIFLKTVTPQSIRIVLKDSLEKEEFGIIYLSPMLVLSNQVDGQFPILHPNTNEYVGIATLRKGEKQEQLPKELQQDKKSNEEEYQHEQMNRMMGMYTHIVLLSVERVLPKDNYRLLVRTNNQVHNIRCKVQDIDSIKVITTEPLVICSISNRSIIQLEIYSGQQLMTYSKFTLLFMQNQVRLLKSYIDSSSELNCISQSYVEIWTVSCTNKFLLSTSNNYFFNVLHQIYLKMFILTDKVLSMAAEIKNICHEITFIQASRMAKLLKNNLQNINQDLQGALVRRSVMKKQLISELMYLDPSKTGYISKESLKELDEYYKIEHQIYKLIDCFNPLIEDHIYQSKFQQDNRKNSIPYLLMIAGYRILQQIIAQPQENLIQPQLANNNSNQANKLILEQKEQFQKLLIRQIKCTNMHYLFTDRKVPSLCTNLTSKIQYRNCNPTFKVHKLIDINNPIIFYDYSVKLEVKTFLTEIQIVRNKSKYIIKKAEIQIIF